MAFKLEKVFINQHLFREVYYGSVTMVTMVQSDFGILRSFIVENRKKRINFNRFKSDRDIFK